MSKKRKFLDDDGEDPTSGIINLTDCMLVLAVGFLVFAIVALQSNPTLISESTGASPNTVQVSTGQTINDTPGNESGSGSNYQQMGTVYKDPKTGKLIMVS
jgi:Uncharacterized conserved protein